jgi:hypothetical protein
MEIAIIKLCKAYIINHSSESEIDKMIFDQTYGQFQKRMNTFMQIPDFTNWKKLSSDFPQAVGPFLKTITDIAKGHYNSFLINDIPAFKDSLGRINIKFSDLIVEVVDSNINEKASHILRLLFISKPYILIKSIEKYLVLAQEEDIEKLKNNESIDSFLIKLNDNVSIRSFQFVQ